MFILIIIVIIAVFVVIVKSKCDKRNRVFIHDPMDAIPFLNLPRDPFGSSWGSFRDRDHFRSSLGIISDLGIISGPVQRVFFAQGLYSCHFQTKLTLFVVNFSTPHFTFWVHLIKGFIFWEFVLHDWHKQRSVQLVRSPSDYALALLIFNEFLRRN